MASVSLWYKMAFQSDTKGKLKISRRRMDQLAVSNQVVTYSCCRLSVIFRGFISHLIGHETINIPEIFSGVHSFMGKTVTNICLRSKASRAHMLVLRTSNFQGATIRLIVPRNKCSLVFIVHY